MHKNTKEGSYAQAFEQSRQKLRQILPDEIAKSTLLQYDGEKKCFTVDSFGHKLEISYPEGQVCLRNGDEKGLSLEWELILLNYLSSAQEKPLKNEWVSYRELPHGNVFYPHIKTHVLAGLGRFFSDCDKRLFSNVLAKLGFTFVDSKADIAAITKFVPRVPVFIQFWEGEDQIPSSCQILFDRTIADQMHIEDAAALCMLTKKLIFSYYKNYKNLQT